MGASMSAGKASEVFHIRLIPSGKSTWALKSGLSPFSSAWGVQARNQVASLASTGIPPPISVTLGADHA